MLFVARDHFGVKPFYYFKSGDRFAFASEVKALLQVSGIEAELDPQSLHQYLTFLWVPDPKTMFRHVMKLPAGHCATLRNGERHYAQYWDLTFPDAGQNYARSEDDLAEEIRETLPQVGYGADGQRCSNRCVSERRIGFFEHCRDDAASHRSARSHLHCYVPWEISCGRDDARRPGRRRPPGAPLGMRKPADRGRARVTELLPQLVWHMDEPTADPAIIAAHLVCREARKQATVLLSGVGGDELFAGYRKHVAHYWAQAYAGAPAAARHALEGAVGSLPALRGTFLKGRIRLAKKMARSASLDPVERFIANCTYFDSEQKAELYADGFSVVAASDPAREHHAAFGRVKHADFLHQMLYLDTKIFMASLNLTYNDKMSMASSVEVRVPFLDRELAEFVAWNVPPGLKLKGAMRPTTKYILRRAMQDVLPREVLQQPKAGLAGSGRLLAGK